MAIGLHDGEEEFFLAAVVALELVQQLVLAGQAAQETGV